MSKEALERGRERCNPIGFKIGLELMVRCKCTNIKDVAITFQERTAGESKLTMKQNVEYLVQLGTLYFDKSAILFLLFWNLLLALVGLIIGYSGLPQLTLRILFR